MGAPPHQEVVRGEREPFQLPAVETPPAPPENKATKKQKAQQQQQQPSPRQHPREAVGFASNAAANPDPDPGHLMIKGFSKMKEKNTLRSDLSSPASPPQQPQQLRASRKAGMARPPNPLINRKATATELPAARTSLPARLTNSPSMTITPINRKSGGGGPQTSSPFRTGRGSEAAAESKAAPTSTSALLSSLPLSSSISVTPMGSGGGSPASPVGKPALRPPLSTPVSCSIHCPGAGVRGYPSLSCVACQSLFHPTCVGLLDGIEYSAAYDFYCANCRPPPEKENAKPPEKPPVQLGSRLPPPPPPSRRKSSERSPHLLLQPQQPRKATQAKMQQRLIHSQSVVNIAGHKYLVVPHPEPPLNGKSDEDGRTGTGMTRRPAATSKALLPILLKPSVEGSMPTFEVEEAPDGKLLLVPSSGKADKMNMFTARDEKKEVIEVEFGSRGRTIFTVSYLPGFRRFEALETLQAGLSVLPRLCVSPDAGEPLSRLRRPHARISLSLTKREGSGGAGLQTLERSRSQPQHLERSIAKGTCARTTYQSLAYSMLKTSNSFLHIRVSG